MTFVFIALGILLVVGVALSLARRPSNALPASTPLPVVTPPSSDHARAVTDALMRLRFDAQVAGSPATAALDGIVARLLEAIARVEARDDAALESMEELVRDRLRPAVLSGDVAGTEGAGRSADELLAFLSLRREPLDAVATRRRHETLAAIQSLQPSVSTVKLTDVRSGDALRIEGRPYRVESIHRYDESYQGRRWEWREIALLDLETGIASGLDVEEDDGLELSIQTGKPTLEELGLTAAMLARFDDEESGSVRFGTRRFSYADSGKARFSRDGTGEWEPYDYWEFETADGSEAIAVERWEGARFEAFVMRKVDPLSVEAFATGGKR